MEAQDRPVMETKIATIHRKMLIPARQLPINGFAHKTGVIGNTRVRTVLAALDVSAENRCATNLDRSHDTALTEAHVTGIGHAPGLAVAAEDVRRLQLRLGHVSAVRPKVQRRCSGVQADLYLSDRVEGDPRIPRRRCDMAVAKQVLDHADVDALFQKVSRKAVPQGVNGHLLVQLSSCGWRQARWTERAVTCLDGSGPGNNQCEGRSRFQ
jgi:hypothetical protein